MRDIDPQLMRLRELEARIALAEFHLREQQEMAERLKSRGLDTAVADQMCETLRDGLGVLRVRQDSILATMTGDSPYADERGGPAPVEAGEPFARRQHR